MVSLNSFPSANSDSHKLYEQKTVNIEADYVSHPNKEPDLKFLSAVFLM
jgi:hypothetical protein